MKLFIGAEELPIVWTDVVGITESPPYLIARLAHGDIEVKSTVGQGSTFPVTLPINGGAR